MRLVTADQMREMDRQTIETFGLPGLVLMESAGRGAVDFFINRYSPGPDTRVAVLAGRGNNGGDGFVMARYLVRHHIPVTVFLLSSREKITGDAETNMVLFETLCSKSEYGHMVEIPDAGTFKAQKTRMVHYSLFIDAILGTGLNSDVRGFYKDAVELLNQVKKPVFSVDIPSGLNADTGRPMGVCVQADATATFGRAKTGLVLFPGNQYTGELKVIDIGIPEHVETNIKSTLSLIEKEDIARNFPDRDFSGHKGRYGHLLVLGGSPGKTGAAALCANAAARCGTGLVTLGVAEQVNPSLEPMVVEPMTHPLPDQNKGLLTKDAVNEIRKLARGKQAMALGPGLGTAEDTRTLVHDLVKTIDLPMVIDADGLNCLANHPEILKQKKGRLILTPHPGEMSRLCGRSTADIQADRIATASEFAQNHDLILVLKGAQTVISLPDGRSYICPTGNPGMASGGMGDVLTGMIAGFCAQGMAMEEAALSGVFIHGFCADLLAEKIGPFGFLASDLTDHIPQAIHRLL